MHSPAYNRENGKANARYTEESIPDTRQRTQNDNRNGRMEAYRDLSGAYKKKAHLAYDVNRNLREFYAASKANDRQPVLMGQIEDPSARMTKKPKTATVSSEENTDNRRTQKSASTPTTDGTRFFKVPARGESVRSQRADTTPKNGRQTYSSVRYPNGEGRYAAFHTQEGTRLFQTPTGGGEAVKTRRKLVMETFLGALESMDQRWHRDFDLAKKQALLHKKLLEHRRGLMLAITILLIIGLCSAGLYQMLFVVRQVETVGASRYSSVSVAEAAGIQGTSRIFDFTEQEIANRVTLSCPYIRSVKLERQLPSTVMLTVEEDEAVYCANIFGEIVALSPGLRVLGYLTEEEAAAYILLRLPGVAEAITGKTLVFMEERNNRYIRLVLDEVKASRMDGRISYMDLRSEYDIILHCDGMYKLEMGNTVDLKLKLRLADGAISNPEFPQNTPAVLDMGAGSVASVIADLRLNLQETP